MITSFCSELDFRVHLHGFIAPFQKFWIQTVLLANEKVFLRYDVGGLCNGILAGVVSITAGCGNLTNLSAIIVAVPWFAKNSGHGMSLLAKRACSERSSNGEVFSNNYAFNAFFTSKTSSFLLGCIRSLFSHRSGAELSIQSNIPTKHSRLVDFTKVA